jgi:hypothetical protein
VTVAALVNWNEADQEGFNPEDGLGTFVEPANVQLVGVPPL